MTYMHPDTERHPVTPFAHDGALYWCQPVDGEIRIGPLGEDRPADGVDGLEEKARLEMERCDR